MYYSVISTIVFQEVSLLKFVRLFVLPQSEVHFQPTAIIERTFLNRAASRHYSGSVLFKFLQDHRSADLFLLVFLSSSGPMMRHFHFLPVLSYKLNAMIF